MNFADILFHNPAAATEAVALIGARSSLTFGTLRDRVGRLAQALLQLGVGRGDRVAIRLGNIPEFVESYLAVAAAGAVAVPLNLRLTVEEQVTLLRDAEPTVLIAAADGLEMAGRVAEVVGTLSRIVLLDGTMVGAVAYETLLTAGDPPQPPLDLPADTPAVILYTSGTTAGVKGAVLTHGNLVSNIRQYQAFVGIPAGSVNLQLSPLYHAANIFCFVHILTGGSTIFLDKPTPLAILEAIQRYRVSFMFTVPTVLYGILDCDERGTFDLSSLRSLQYGGAAITGARLEAALAVFGDRLLHSYGLTEVTSHASILGPQEHRTAAGSIGHPLPGVEMRVVDRRGEICAPGEVGEILVRGPNVSPGYWRKPQETAETLAGGWLHTGDLGRQDEAGYFYVVGRKKDLIISGGVNIYPQDVEEVLARHPAVGEAAVFGIQDEVWGEAVVAAVVLRPGWSVDAEKLKTFARASLGGFKVPKMIVFMEALPKNASGKILKRELRIRVPAKSANGTD